MLRLTTKFLGLAVLFGASIPVFAQETTDNAPITMYSMAPKLAPRPMLSALSAAQDGDWPWAESLAERAGPGALAMVQSMKFLAGAGTAKEMVAFTRANPNWPDLDTMRSVTEAALTGAPPEDIVSYFSDAPPQSGKGALLYSDALKELGRTEEAKDVLIYAWRSFDLTPEEHDEYMAQHGALLAKYHAERLQMTLWRGLKDVAQMLPLVSDKQRKRAEARMAIENGTTSVDEVFAGLSAEDKHDAGISYALFNYYIETDQAGKALEKILVQSKRADGLGQPEEWAGWRLYLARSQLQDGNYLTAYELSSRSQLTEGSKFADLEWLAGYIALMHLDEPQTAVRHFQNLARSVSTPISLGRAWYWTGRAYEAADDPEAANEAYMEGAEFQSSYYGLLAAEKAGVEYDLDPDTPVPDEADITAEIESNALFGAAVMSRAAGQTQMSLRLLYALADSLPERNLPTLGREVEAWGDPFFEIKLGKRLARRGVILARHYFAMHPLADLKLPVPTELAMAIARRESEFNPSVRSEAGAEGLMQVMPGTAKDVAGALGIAYDPDKPLRDWNYNALLGSSYLARLAKQFDGNIVMIAAGYNAGPGRPVQWMEKYGDPRKPGGINVVDWIELIPFNETRNYVMRVAESLPIYRKRLGKPALPQPFSQELAGTSFGQFLSQAHMSSQGELAPKGD